jgi:hypothetical protein
MPYSNTNNIAELATRFVNNTGKNIFLTGKAGTGKTTFLKYIISNTYKKTVIAAPTGIAAINASGVTLHSLFQLPFGAFIPNNNAQPFFSENSKINTPNTLFKHLQLNKTKRKLLQELELLIIDEVSMLRADLLDAIDSVLKSIRKKNNLAFGGVQVLFIGDLLQLPPVVKDDEWNILKNYYNSPFFFDALVLQNNKPLYIELDKIYRQTDKTFINLLNNLRNNTVNESDVQTLNTFFKPNFKPTSEENYIQLTTHNYKADNLNKLELQKLKSTSFFYKAIITGDFSEYSCPIDEVLELKIGAQIMFIKNDPTGQQRFFNGKIGKVYALNKDEISVIFDDKKIISVDTYEWENIKYTLNETTNEIEEKITGTFKQYPIKLAWAITIHKSQGLTFDKAIIDIGDAFAPGQVYVALSRLTSLNGLVLASKINYESIFLNKEIENFSKTKNKETELHSILKEESSLFLKTYILQSFNFNNTNIKIQQYIDTLKKEEKKSVKQKHLLWIIEIKNEFEEIKKIADKFLQQLNTIFESQDANNKALLKERIKAACVHFIPLLKKLSKKIISKTEQLKSEKKVKTFIAELLELDAAIFKQIQQIQKGEAMINSADSNIIFSKEIINSKHENLEKTNELREINYPLQKTTTKNKKNEKAEKIDTKKVSFELYKKGNNTEQIAKQRNLATTTIEGHLAYYVSLGMLPINDFVETEKLQNIITVVKTINSTKLSEIMEKLGDEYTYSNIKFSLAYFQNAKKDDI